MFLIGGTCLYTSVGALRNLKSGGIALRISESLRIREMLRSWMCLSVKRTFKRISGLLFLIGIFLVLGANFKFEREKADISREIEVYI